MTAMPDLLSQAAAPLQIAVFRALNLGDLLCSVPAFRALRAAFPAARITLIGLNSARPIMARFPHYLDELVLFPGDDDFPEQDVDHEALPGFYSAMAARRFDLAIQMHGSGKRSNHIVSRLGARVWTGFVPCGTRPEPGRLMLWPDHLREPLRYLALLQAMGLELALDEETAAPELPLLAADEDEADALIASLDLDVSRLVIVHPGARLRSRRWPVQRYAAVVRALNEDGWQVVLTGSAEEAPLTAQLRSLCQAANGNCDVIDACARTSLGGMAALLRRARLLISNDTGVSHIAAAVAAPSVVIACGSDVARWAPGDARRHSVLYADTACRPCAWEECPYAGHPCASGVGVDDVLAQARRRLGPVFAGIAL